MSSPKVLLDTNIVAYLMRGDPVSLLYVPHVRGKLLSISFITVGEMLSGAEMRGWGTARRNQLESNLRNYIVVPYHWEVAQRYARITAERRQAGRPIALHDAWIAACALRHGLPIVTHNAKDFEGITGLEVITEYRRSSR